MLNYVRHFRWVLVLYTERLGYHAHEYKRNTLTRAAIGQLHMSTFLIWRREKIWSLWLSGEFSIFFTLLAYANVSANYYADVINVHTFKD